MAFSTQDRVDVRHFLGYASIFVQDDTRLESALTAIQAMADGGSQPDGTAEAFIKATVADAYAVEAALRALWPKMAALSVDELKVDPVRAATMLRSEGRRIVTNLSSMLSTQPRRDVFSSTPASLSGSNYPNT